MRIIVTRYRTRPGSNVGAYVARGHGRQVSVIDQSLPDPHRTAAERLAVRLVGDGATVTPTGSSPDGQRRTWRVEGSVTDAGVTR